MVSPNTAVGRKAGRANKTEPSPYPPFLAQGLHPPLGYRHNRSIAQGNRTKRSFHIAVFIVFTMFVVSWASLIHPLHP